MKQKYGNMLSGFLHIEIPFLVLVLVFPWLMSLLNNNVVSSVVIANIIFIIVYFVTCMILRGND